MNDKNNALFFNEDNDFNAVITRQLVRKYVSRELRNIIFPK